MLGIDQYSLAKRNRGIGCALHWKINKNGRERKLLYAFSMPRKQLKCLSKPNVYWKHIYRPLEEKLELMISGLTTKRWHCFKIAVLSIYMIWYFNIFTFFNVSLGAHNISVEKTGQMLFSILRIWNQRLKKPTWDHYG